MDYTFNGRNTGILHPDSVESLSKQFLADTTARLAMNAVAITDVDTIALDHLAIVGIDTSVSHKADSWSAANQKASGRCWIFAGLNSFRGSIMKQCKIDNFELSQTYIHFWDKLEKANYFLTSMRELANRPVDDRTVSHLLKNPIDDGGQWNMFVSLVQKYGVVPQYAMPETNSSSNTRWMNRDVESALRTGAAAIRRIVAEGAARGGENSADAEANSDAELQGRLDEAHDEALTNVYRILTIHLGIPPEKFVWQYRNKDNEFVREGEFTPVEFAQKYLPQDLDSYVCAVNDPRPTSSYGELYSVEYLGNVVGGKPVTYLNAPIEVLKRAVMESLVEGIPVWFGCDTDAQSEGTRGVWAAGLHDFGSLYGVDLEMSKADKLATGDSMMTHAMVLTGVDLWDDSTDVTAIDSADQLPESAYARRWRVENSWGTDKADKGFWTMDDSWFEHFVYEIAVPISRLPQKYRDIVSDPDRKPHMLPAWDPMGALARE